MKGSAGLGFGLYFAMVVLMSILDLYDDWDERADLFHVATETILMMLSVGGLVFLYRKYRKSARDNKNLRVAVGDAQSMATKWREESQVFLAGLSQSIDKQFARWSLTPAEKEVGRLLLKGFSLKEIATIRSSSERTVSQQAQIIYQKSGTEGRAKFAAFFLEDLLAPSIAE